MHTQISSSNVKGDERLELTLTPANNLEREFFNALFNNNGVKVEQIPNSEDIVIRKKVEAAADPTLKPAEINL